MSAFQTLHHELLSIFLILSVLGCSAVDGTDSKSRRSSDDASKVEESQKPEPASGPTSKECKAKGGELGELVSAGFAKVNGGLSKYQKTSAFYYAHVRTGIALFESAIMVQADGSMFCCDNAHGTNIDCSVIPAKIPVKEVEDFMLQMRSIKGDDLKDPPFRCNVPPPNGCSDCGGEWDPWGYKESSGDIFERSVSDGAVLNKIQKMLSDHCGR